MLKNLTVTLFVSLVPRTFSDFILSRYLVAGNSGSGLEQRYFAAVSFVKTEEGAKIVISLKTLTYACILQRFFTHKIKLNRYYI